MCTVIQSTTIAGTIMQVYHESWLVVVASCLSLAGTTMAVLSHVIHSHWHDTCHTQSLAIMVTMKELVVV